jgi:deoxyribodipyrimidine photolyase-related protein
MRNFANTLKDRGRQVVYLKIRNTDNPQNLPDLIDQIILEKKIEKFEYQLPDEYRLYRQLQAISKSISIPSETFDTEHFYTSRDELENHFKGKKQLLMASFYRIMRRKLIF